MLTYLVLDWVEKLGLIYKAINDLFMGSELLKSAKKSIPDDQKTCIVFVQAVTIRACRNYL